MDKKRADRAGKQKNEKENTTDVESEHHFLEERHGAPKNTNALGNLLLLF